MDGIDVETVTDFLIHVATALVAARLLVLGVRALVTERIPRRAGSLGHGWRSPVSFAVCLTFAGLGMLTGDAGDLLHGPDHTAVIGIGLLLLFLGMGLAAAKERYHKKVCAPGQPAGLARYRSVRPLAGVPGDRYVRPVAGSCSPWLSHS
jgi:hypothetical protein